MILARQVPGFKVENAADFDEDHPQHPDHKAGSLFKAMKSLAKKGGKLKGKKQHAHSAPGVMPNVIVTHARHD